MIRRSRSVGGRFDSHHLTNKTQRESAASLHIRNLPHSPFTQLPRPGAGESVSKQLRRVLGGWTEKPVVGRSSDIQPNSVEQIGKERIRRVNRVPVDGGILRCAGRSPGDRNETGF